MWESISCPRVLVISFFHQLEQQALKSLVAMEHIGNSLFVLLRSKSKFTEKLLKVIMTLTWGTVNTG